MIVRVASPTHDLRVSGSSILDELTWRGLVAQTTDRDALAADIAKGPISVYGGFDPTAASLHAGHLVPLLTLSRFQRAGHRPIVLAGAPPASSGTPATPPNETCTEQTSSQNGPTGYVGSWSDSSNSTTRQPERSSRTILNGPVS